MTRINDLSSISLSAEQLQSILTYGVAVAALYVIGIFAITGFEIRQAKQTQGATSTLPYVTKVFLYALIWVIAVTMFLVLLIGVMPPGVSNPAYGIWGFFKINWISPTMFSSLPVSGMTAEEASSYRGMVLMLMIFKLVYYLLLIGFFIMIFSFVASISSLKRKQSQESFDFSFAIEIFTNFVGAMVVFIALMGTIGVSVEGLMEMGSGLGRLPSAISDFGVNMLDELAIFVQVGAQVLSAWSTAHSVPGTP